MTAAQAAGTSATHLGLRPLGAGYVEDLRLWLHGVIGWELEAVEEP